MPNAFLLIVQLVILFLKNAKSHKNCPDGVCDQPLADASVLAAQLQNPSLSFGVFDLFRFLRCFPMDRVVAVVRRVVALFNGCDHCPDGDCSFLDLIGCIDLKEAVAIAKEILDIIQDSKICDGGGREITLGQASE